MVYPNRFVKHTWQFQLPSGEQALTSCNWAPATGDATLTSADVDALHAKLVAFWTVAKVWFAPAVSLVGSRVALMGTDGKAIQSYERSVTLTPGTASSNSLPTEVSIVASLNTPFAGRRFRGRMYLPPPATSQTTPEGRVNATLRDGLAPEMRDYLSGSVGTSTLSSVVASGVGEGALTAVSAVRVGDVFDAQRRRRESIREAYVTQVVT